MTGGEWDEDRVLLRLQEDVGDVLGVDGVEYDLLEDTVVTLPEVNAEVLLEAGAAEEIDAATATDHVVEEAMAVAGPEPDRAEPVGSDAALDRAIDLELAKRAEADDDQDDGDDEELSAAAFMGGADDSPFASDDPSPTSSSTPATTSSDSLSHAFERPTSALPLAQLDALDPDERRRAARERGLDWPTTREARDQLFATITKVMRNEDVAVVDAPTALGKSHTIATTAWGDDQHLATTGGQPVVHLQATRDARDEAAHAADAAEGVDYFMLESRHEACPVAAGSYDPSDDPDQSLELTIDGTPASEWLEAVCDGRGVPFSAAHRHLEKHNDQGVELPCCSGESGYDEEAGDFVDEPSECPAIRQWEALRDRRDDLDVVIATHNFAHVPGLRAHTNLVFDEEPDFAADLGKERIERAIGAYLRAIDAPVQTWEAFVGLARYDGYGDDAAKEADALQDALNEEPPLEHYLEDPDAHVLAPALARAIFHAEERCNGRRVGRTPYEPPRLDAHAADEDSWNREWVTVVLDADNRIRTVRCAPDVSQARSVVGLDAHPAQPRWATNVHPSIQIKQVLDPHRRQLWRRYERGLRVVQVGEATRPLASGEYFNERQVEALVEHLREQYGSRFSTAITTMAVEDRLETILEDAGVQHPATMHYGAEKSRNDFGHERVGLVNGCIDPGDDFVLDLLAELDLEAQPETVEDDDGEVHRARGRGFEGEDADTAREILASVRENHTAQAAGRYARDPDDPDSHATVFVRTDAMPPGFADVEVPGVEWVYSTKQEDVVEALRDRRRPATARELASETGVSKRHVHRILERLADHGNVQAIDGAGEHGATLYADDGTPTAGVVDLTDEDGNIVTDHVRGPYTWSVTIRDPSTPEQGDAADDGPGTRPTGGLFAFADDPGGGGPGS